MKGKYFCISPVGEYASKTENGGQRDDHIVGSQIIQMANISQVSDVYKYL